MNCKERKEKMLTKYVIKYGEEIAPEIEDMVEKGDTKLGETIRGIMWQGLLINSEKFNEYMKEVTGIDVERVVREDEIGIKMTAREEMGVTNKICDYYFEEMVTEEKIKNLKKFICEEADEETYRKIMIESECLTFHLLNERIDEILDGAIDIGKIVISQWELAEILSGMLIQKIETLQKEMEKREKELIEDVRIAIR